MTQIEGGSSPPSAPSAAAPATAPVESTTCTEPILAACIPTRGLVIFPGMMRVVSVGRPTTLAAVSLHLDEDHLLVVVPQRDADDEDPTAGPVSSVGVLAQILRITQLPDGTSRVLLEGLERARLLGGIHVRGSATVVAVEQLESRIVDPITVGARAHELVALYQEYTSHSGVSGSEHWTLAATADDPERLADQVTGVAEMSLEHQVQHLEEPVLDRRLDASLKRLSTQIARLRIAAEVNTRVQQAMDDSQREYHLKEQLKAIRAELGEAMGGEADVALFERRIAEAGMPEEVRDEAVHELERLRRVHTDAAEYTIIRTWLETICDLPWSHSTTDTASLVKAQRSLDRDHHALDKVKERILEYLAVRQLQPESKGPILCFVGPPGVGKTSLGRSIAKALGREYARIALGGVKDETEIRGHRRTYVGALPGRLIRALSRSGSRNPVLVLDEIDKVGNDFRGDPASALLEVLDPEQNHQFVDHYLDVAVDLSHVLFIATANLPDPIPPALLDRLELIEIPGYTEEEKTHIARKHLLPKLARNHGLTRGDVQIPIGTVRQTIRDYTREAGVRDLERQLATMHRKVARRIVEGHSKRIRITKSTVASYLGPPRYFQELADLDGAPGVVIGLAWTAAGGEILFVEATKMAGKMGLKLTGCLGDVMKESAEAAMSWLRSHALDYGVPASTFEAEFHLHVPAGAIPKDGPSAGVTMVTALASLVTGRPVRPLVAMTGEMTLRGKVLPVGGLKEKALAARRAGVRELVVPNHNRNDLEDVPAELRTDLTFHFVDRIGQVLDVALEEAPITR